MDDIPGLIKDQDDKGCIIHLVKGVPTHTPQQRVIDRHDLTTVRPPKDFNADLLVTSPDHSDLMNGTVLHSHAPGLELLRSVGNQGFKTCWPEKQTEGPEKENKYAKMIPAPFAGYDLIGDQGIAGPD